MSQFGSQELEDFRSLLERVAGLHFDESRASELRAVVEARLNELRLGYASYRQLLLEGQELRAIAARITTPESFFFRTREHFDAVAGRLLPELIRQGRRQFNILSIGCAAGEEPYSMAICIRERLPQIAASVSITACDLNPAAIEKARAGVYTAWSLRGLEEPLRSKYFQRSGGRYELAPEIRRAVRFEQQNLLHLERLHACGSASVVFFRNVLIYFSPTQAAAALRAVASCMHSGAYLFVAPAENLRGLSNDFDLLHSDGAFYYRRKAELGRPAEPQWTPEPLAAEAPPADLTFAPDVLDDTWFHDVMRSTARVAQLASGRPGRARKSPVKREKAPPAGMNAAFAFIAAEQFGPALEALESEAAAGNRDAQVLKASVLVALGRYAEAEALCDAILHADSLNAPARYLKAQCREHAADSAAAIEHNRYAMYLDPSFAMPHLHCGLLCRRAGDAAGARECLEKAVLLLAREDVTRLLVFGGGFSREGLIALARRELQALGGKRS